MRPDGTDWLGVELRGIYDGVSIYLHADGRIVNRWATEDWRGSSRWARTEDYIEHNRDSLFTLIRDQFPSGADGDDQQGDAAGQNR